MTGASAPAGGPDALRVQGFDGVSARPRDVQVTVEGRELCLAEADGTQRRVPLRDVQWPERQRHGARVIHLADGSSLHCADPGDFDRWARRQSLHESWVVKAQQSWRWTAAGVVLLLVVVAAGFEWVVPWTARATLAFVPLSVDRELGDLAMESIQADGMLEPSALPEAQRRRLRDAWVKAEARAHPDKPPITLHFHGSDLGPNAFALPGGHVVITDEMVELMRGDETMVIGVLAHEAGHVHHRHGMRMLAQTAVLSTVSTVAFGDFSGFLATAPAVLGHLSYSRDLEREADGEAIAVLQANGMSPAVMADMFERLKRYQREKGMPNLPIAFGSHPPDEERIERFRQAAGER